jgi:hypothetical protein
VTTLEYNGRKRSNKEELVYWILQRESIRLKKEASLPKPWTEDWIFKKTYFCNVRREDDKVTRWLRQNWNPQYLGWEDYEHYTVLARFLNWPDTLDALDLPATPEVVFETMEERRLEGKKVWGNAYVVTTHGIPMGKAAYLCQRVLPAAYELLGAGRWRTAYAGRAPSLAARHEELRKLEGMGSFMSAQVLADLKNTPGHPLDGATDWLSWSAPGPGSLRGLAWFHERKVPESDYGGAIEAVADYLDNFPEVVEILSDNMMNGINMQDLQNCLCEYDKYLRVKNDVGRSKRNYPGS